MVVPIDVLPSKSSTVLFASATPVNVGVLSFVMSLVGSIAGPSGASAVVKLRLVVSLIPA